MFLEWLEKKFFWVKIVSLLVNKFFSDVNVYKIVLFFYKLLDKGGREGSSIASIIIRIWGER